MFVAVLSLVPAQLLGPITISANSKIGAGAIVLDSVPAHVTAVGNPAHLVATQLHAYHETTSNQAWFLSKLRLRITVCSYQLLCRQ